MSRPFSSITTSGHDIIMKMLSIIYHSLSPHYNQQSRYSHVNAVSYMSKSFSSITTSSHENAVSYMSKPFSSIATGSHDIVMKMLSVICEILSPPLQLVVTIQSCKCCQLYVKAFLHHYNQQSRHSHENAERHHKHTKKA